MSRKINEVLNTLTPERRERAEKIRDGKLSVKCGICSTKSGGTCKRRFKLVDGRFVTRTHKKGTTLFATGSCPDHDWETWTIVAMKRNNK
jgi:hypothetical protein